jgi:hypothetical protein
MSYRDYFTKEKSTMSMFTQLKNWAAGMYKTFRRNRQGFDVVRKIKGLDRKVDRDPPPLPDFSKLWVFRWVREDVMNQDDKPYYYDSKLEEIWQPCKVKDHPEFWPEDDDGDDDFQDFINEKGNFKVGGLILCKSLKDKMDKQPRDSKGRFLPKNREAVT